MDFIYLLGGLVLLFISGELLVKGAVSVAYRFKISKLVVGLTVVSLGTSAPELFVSLMAAINGHSDIAIGNVVGSNIANLGLVLAITILIFPIVINAKVGKIDYPVLFASTVIFLIVISDRVITSNEGVFLVSILILYSFLLVKSSRKETKKLKQVVAITRKQFYFGLIFILVGIVGLKYGSQFFLNGAISLAEKYGLSDHLIGVTIVAFGTSVPELTTSVIAAFRKHGDISLGNLIGSNVFNVHAVLGITAIVSEIPVTERILSFDFLWMAGFVLALIPAIYFKKRFNRYEGVIFLLAYIAYIYLSFAGPQ
jgi:cation:H+ antiporter